MGERSAHLGLASALRLYTTEIIPFSAPNETGANPNPAFHEVVNI